MWNVAGSNVVLNAESNVRIECANVESNEESLVESSVICHVESHVESRGLSPDRMWNLMWDRIDSRCQTVLQTSAVMFFVEHVCSMSKRKRRCLHAPCVSKVFADVQGS